MSKMTLLSTERICYYINCSGIIVYAYKHPLDHWKSERIPENHLLLLYWLCQSLWLCDHNKLWKILKDIGILDQLLCLLRNLYVGPEQHLELDMEQQTGSKLEKKYVKAAYCHLLISLICRIHHAKCRARWSTS